MRGSQLRKLICWKKKQAMKELLKERRSTEEEEWRETQMLLGVGATQMGATGSRSSETEGDLFLSQGEILKKETEEDQRSFGQVKAPLQKRRAVTRVTDGGGTILCLSAPADESLGAENGGGG